MMLQSLYHVLKSKKLGIVAGFTAAGLLIFGSLLINFLPEHYQGLSGEDITFFFKNPSLLNIWFYLLFAGLVVYGLNSFFCTLEAVTTRLRAGVKDPSLYGGSVIHVAFMLTLVAHLVGGLYTTQERPVTIGERPVQYGNVEIRLVDLETTQYPDGMPREVRASLRVKKAGVEESRVLGYNQPLLLDMGAREFLLRDYGSMPQGVVLRVGGKPYNLKVKDSLNVNGYQLQVAGLIMPPAYNMPVARLVADKGDGVRPEQVFLPLGDTNSQTINGLRVVFEDVKVSKAVVVGLKENPSIPLALGTTLLFCVGVALVVWRLLRRITYQL